MTLAVLLCSILFGDFLIAWGYAQVGLSVFGLCILILGAGWLYAAWRGWTWYASGAVSFLVVSAGYGLWVGVNPYLVFATGAFSLLAWDVADFRRRLLRLTMDDDTREVERRHLARIAGVALSGFFLASFTLSLQVQFTFEWIAVLLILALLGLGQLVHWFKR